MEEVKKPKIYTSYYAKSKALNREGIVGVGISLIHPSWFTGINILDLAPTWGMMNMSKADYREAYRKKLESVNFNYIFRHIKSVSKGKSVALLCFESLKTGKSNDWCHRTMLAEWLNERYDFFVEEWIDPNDFLKDKKIKDKEILEKSQLRLGF